MQSNFLIIIYIYLGIISTSAYDTDFDTDDADEYEESDDNYSDRKLLMMESELRDYLGYYSNFVSEKDSDWCPKKCDNGNETYESPNLRSYCTCGYNKHTIRHDCQEHEIFNSSLGFCHELPGKGISSCIIKKQNCPRNQRGIIRHPNRNYFQHYILCMDDLVIAAKCDDMHYYNDEKKTCERMHIDNTYLALSDCPIVPEIECEKTGIIPMKEYEYLLQNEKVRCTNCFYICGIKDIHTFELKISCENIITYVAGQWVHTNKSDSQIIENIIKHHGSNKDTHKITTNLYGDGSYATKHRGTSSTRKEDITEHDEREHTTEYGHHPTRSKYAASESTTHKSKRTTPSDHTNSRSLLTTGRKQTTENYAKTNNDTHKTTTNRYEDSSHATKDSGTRSTWKEYITKHHGREHEHGHHPTASEYTAEYITKHHGREHRTEHGQHPTASGYTVSEGSAHKTKGTTPSDHTNPISSSTTGRKQTTEIFAKTTGSERTTKKYTKSDSGSSSTNIGSGATTPNGGVSGTRITVGYTSINSERDETSPKLTTITKEYVTSNGSSSSTEGQRTTEEYNTIRSSSSNIDREKTIPGYTDKNGLSTTKSEKTTEKYSTINSGSSLSITEKGGNTPDHGSSTIRGEKTIVDYTTIDSSSSIAKSGGTTLDHETSTTASKIASTEGNEKATKGYVTVNTDFDKTVTESEGTTTISWLSTTESDETTQDHTTINRGSSSPLSESEKNETKHTTVRISSTIFSHQNTQKHTTINDSSSSAVTISEKTTPNYITMSSSTNSESTGKTGNHITINNDHSSLINGISETSPDDTTTIISSTTKIKTTTPKYTTLRSESTTEQYTIINDGSTSKNIEKETTPDHITTSISTTTNEGTTGTYTTINYSSSEQSERTSQDHSISESEVTATDQTINSNPLTIGEGTESEVTKEKISINYDSEESTIESEGTTLGNTNIGNHLSTISGEEITGTINSYNKETTLDHTTMGISPTIENDQTTRKHTASIHDSEDTTMSDTPTTGSEEITKGSTAIDNSSSSKIIEIKETSMNYWTTENRGITGKFTTLDGSPSTGNEKSSRKHTTLDSKKSTPAIGEGTTDFKKEYMSSSRSSVTDSEQKEKHTAISGSSTLEKSTRAYYTTINSGSDSEESTSRHTTENESSSNGNEKSTTEQTEMNSDSSSLSIRSGGTTPYYTTMNKSFSIPTGIGGSGPQYTTLITSITKSTKTTLEDTTISNSSTTGTSGTTREYRTTDGGSSSPITESEKTTLIHSSQSSTMGRGNSGSSSSTTEEYTTFDSSSTIDSGISTPKHTTIRSSPTTRSEVLSTTIDSGNSMIITESEKTTSEYTTFDSSSPGSEKTTEKYTTNNDNSSLSTVGHTPINAGSEKTEEGRSTIRSSSTEGNEATSTQKQRTSIHDRRSTTGSGGSTSEHTSPLSSSTRWSTTKEYEYPESTNNLSDRPCPSEGFFRYNFSCSSHYECYYSKRHRRIVASRVYDCPKCLKFNAKDRRCDLPENVAECSIHEPNYQYLKSHRLTKPVRVCSGPGIFADPLDDGKFYKCVDILDENINYLTVSFCPNETKFNPDTQQCERQYERQKNYNVFGGCKLMNYAFHKFSCQKFFYCVDDAKPVELKCLDGYMFNGQFCEQMDQTMFCNWEQLKRYLYRNRN